MSGDEATHPNRYQAMSTIERQNWDAERFDSLLRYARKNDGPWNDSDHPWLPEATAGNIPDEGCGARLIACINACAGMADPEKEIAALRASDQRADRLEKALEDMLGWMAKHDGYCVCSKCESIREAEAALASPSGGEKSGPSDGEMLDWVEKAMREQAVSLPDYDEEMRLWFVFCGCGDNPTHHYFPTLRAAITSAMEGRA